MNNTQKVKIRTLENTLLTRLEERNRAAASRDYAGRYQLVEFKAEKLDGTNLVSIIAKVTLMGMGDYNRITSEKYVHVFMGARGALKSGKKYGFGRKTKEVKSWSDAITFLS